MEVVITPDADTAAEVVPVVKVDSRPIVNGTPGEITRQLMTRFKKLTQS